MKKVLMMVALIGAMIAGSQVQAAETNRFERTPIADSSIQPPCGIISILGGGSGIFAMKNIMNFGYKK